MIKIRLFGTPEDIENASEIIRKTFDVLEESNYYPNNNKKSRCGRKYFDCRTIKNEGGANT